MPSHCTIPKEKLIRDHNVRYNPRAVKRGAEAPAESDQAGEPGPKRLRVEKSVAMTEESMIEDKLLAKFIFAMPVPFTNVSKFKERCSMINTVCFNKDGI